MIDCENVMSPVTDLSFYAYESKRFRFFVILCFLVILHFSEFPSFSI